MELILDAVYFGNGRQVHNYIANALQFPDWYGHNLDALYDCLTERRADTVIHLKSWPRSGPLYRIGWVMQEAAEENPHINVIME